MGMRSTEKQVQRVQIWFINGLWLSPPHSRATPIHADENIGFGAAF